MKRRAFLQQIGWTLAALGISETGLCSWSDRYSQALAQSTPRKLALLIGINQYPQVPLSGCVTDVDLQRELLTYRFGFHPTDILSLTDQQATRQNIETAFLTHLTEQARPGDLVVLHFSGYGSRVNQPTGETGDQITPPCHSLVPVDGMLTTKGEGTNHVLLETLGSLLRSLPTESVITCLDASYGATASPISSFPPGVWRVRSQPGFPVEPASEAEIAFQKELLKRGKATRYPKMQLQGLGQFPGVLLTATAVPDATAPGLGHKAFEAQWNGFTAGLLTYSLTQELWASTPAMTLQVSFRRAASQIEQWVGKAEHPILIETKSPDKLFLSPSLATNLNQGAEGAIIALEEDGKIGKAWLAGLPATVLEHYGINSLLTLVPLPGESLTETLGTLATPLVLQVISREGLSAKVKRVSDTGSDPLQVGQQVQELVRILPRTLGLVVALDPSLGRIERVDATSAFSDLGFFKLATVAEQPADYLFGRVQETPRPTPESSTSEPMKSSEFPHANSSEGMMPPSQYGLFSLGQSLIPTTIGDREEAVKTAVHRLIPQLRTLLAAKLLRLTANEGSSRLGVRATLEMITPQEQVIMHRETRRPIPLEGPPSFLASNSNNLGDGVPALPIGSHIRYRIYNEGNRPVYWILLGLDSSGKAIALYSSQAAPRSEEPEAKPVLQQQVVAPNETITVPDASNVFDWVIREPIGLAETQLVFSRAPFTQTLAALETSIHPMGSTQRLGVPAHPLEVAQAILQDLHNASTNYNASNNVAPVLSLASDSYALNVNSWATLSFIYQVV